MAEQLTLWAINVADIRSWFQAPEDLANALRAAAKAVLTDDQAATKRFLLRRKPQAPANAPTYHDVDVLLGGQFVPNDRLDASWVIVRSWLDEFGFGHITTDLPRARLDDWEFDLVRTGVPTQLSIRHLWSHSLDVGPRTTSNMSVGYISHQLAQRLVQHWQEALEELEPETAEFAKTVINFAASWSQNPAQPDIVALWTSR